MSATLRGKTRLAGLLLEGAEPELAAVGLGNLVQGI